MKKFIINLGVFSVIVVTILSFILMTYGGYVDYFYLKFTTPKQSSFIIGDSRSFQGIQPSVIDLCFKDNEFQLPMMNYSFTITQAAYGEVYTQSIKNKLNLKTKNGLFIVTVNPWVLAKREKDIFEKKVFEEEENPPHNMSYVSMNPNFEYFFKNYNYFHFKSIFKKTSKLHNDGWLEENNLPKDKTTLQDWKKNQLKIYSGFSKKWKPCEYRMNELNKLISFLEEYGTVVIVRMPIDKEILALETEFWKDFDYTISEISRTQNVNYFNFSKMDNYQTYDGNHLDKFGGKIFTKQLCDSIKKYKR